MADRLVVDVDGLQTLADRLESIRARLDAGSRTMRAVAGHVGSSQVYTACEDFEDHWRDGREKIDGNAENLARMLHSSADAFRDTDEQLRSELETSTTVQAQQ
jgi:ABC-type transporter Mla subunit MlaD